MARYQANIPAMSKRLFLQEMPSLAESRTLRDIKAELHSLSKIAAQDCLYVDIALGWTTFDLCS